jgi:hypothetical protein
MGVPGEINAGRYGAIPISEKKPAGKPDPGRGAKNKTVTYKKGDTIPEDILLTKPEYSRVPEKWLNEKNGTISIDSNGVWTYTNKRGISVSYINGYPDFTPFYHPTVGPVKIKVSKPTDRPKDNKAANKAAKLNKDSDPPVLDMDQPPSGYTWHHLEDGETMVLVERKVHSEFTHSGGVAKVNN